MPKVETDPDGRYTIVPGWPQRPAAENMEEQHEKGADAPPSEFCGGNAPDAAQRTNSAIDTTFRGPL